MAMRGTSDTTWLALLRGINVGGRNVIRMAELRECFASEGFRDVVTYIQSGNVVFRSAASGPGALTARIEGMLATSFDYRARITLRSLEQMRTAPARVNFGREVAYMIACNWKTYIDNYQEGYHIPPLHPSLHRDLDWTRYRVINFEGGSLHDGPQKGGSTHPGSYGWRFPSFMFNSYPEGVSFLRTEPVGHDRTRLVYQFWTPDGAGAAELEAAAAYGMQLADEDIGIVELVQQNLNAGVYEQGPLSPRHENGLYHFHQMVRAAVDPAATQAMTAAGSSV